MEKGYYHHGNFFNCWMFIESQSTIKMEKGYYASNFY